MMDELKLQESEALDILEAMLDVCDLDNPGPMFAGQHVRGGICKIMDDDAAKLRQYIAARRVAPENEPLEMSPKHKAALTELVEMMNEDENKPLTLEGLRQMDGEPVYLVINDGESTLEMWALICVDDVNYPKDKPVVLRNSAGGHDLFFNDKELEQEGIHVYARRPEGSEKV